METTTPDRAISPRGKQAASSPSIPRRVFLSLASATAAGLCLASPAYADQSTPLDFFARIFGAAASSGQGEAEPSHEVYLAKIDECVALYGPPAWTPGSYQGVSEACGLCFAKVLDMGGAGSGQLVVAYRNPNADSSAAVQDVTQAYAVEVWDCEGDAATCVYQARPSFSNGGFPLVSIARRNGRWCIAEDMSGESTKLMGFVDGSVGVVGELSAHFSAEGSTVEYLVDGTPVGEEEYFALRAELDASMERYYLWDMEGTPATVETGAPETVYRTAVMLERAEGALALGGLLQRDTEVGVRFSTPYYAIELPGELYPEGSHAEYSDLLYSLDGSGTGMLYGYGLSVYPVGGEPFSLQVHSPEWSGIQGDFSVLDLGASSADSQMCVSVYAPNQDGAESYEVSSAKALDTVNAASAYVSLEGYRTPDDRHYDYLFALYTRIAGYDADVATMAENFNAYFTTWDWTTAHAEQVSVSTLNSLALGEYDRLCEQGIPQDSAFYACSQDALTLLQDLSMRALPIQAAWEIRANYDVPADHAAEICAPFAWDADENGVNIYKRDFDERYPGANPFLAARR